MMRGLLSAFSSSRNVRGSSRNVRDRLPFETDEEYTKRLRGIMNGYRKRVHSTVARDKRLARKRRNQLRAKGR